MREPLDMTGKVVIVTGGGRGVGRGISARFLEAGAEVVICGRTPPESLPARRAQRISRRRARARAELAVIVSRCSASGASTCS
jgi:NAD(P)-dependent dehydrogenase (short-subunit alcohol dehydrogenase family)